MARGRKKMTLDGTIDDSAVDTSIGPVDEHVGARISARRRLLQLSQKQLAEKLGITFQQIQKYEKGVNRIGAGRLYSIATILGVDIDYFYNDFLSSDVDLPYCDDTYIFMREDSVEDKQSTSDNSESTMLLKAYYSLSPKARAGLLTMLMSLKDKEEFDIDV